MLEPECTHALPICTNIELRFGPEHLLSHTLSNILQGRPVDDNNYGMKGMNQWYWTSCLIVQKS